MYKLFEDYVVFLKHAHEILSDSKDMQNQLEEVFRKYRKYYNDKKLTKKKLQNLWEYVEVINTYDEKLIFKQGKKLLNGK
jgi:hypothetical protein